MRIAGSCILWMIKMTETERITFGEDFIEASHLLTESAKTPSQLLAELVGSSYSFGLKDAFNFTLRYWNSSGITEEGEPIPFARWLDAQVIFERTQGRVSRALTNDVATLLLADGRNLIGLAGLAFAQTEIGSLAQKLITVRLNGGHPVQVLRGQVRQEFGDDLCHPAHIRQLASSEMVKEFVVALLTSGLFPRKFTPEILGVELYCAAKGLSELGGAHTSSELCLDELYRHFEVALKFASACGSDESAIRVAAAYSLTARVFGGAVNATGDQPLGLGEEVLALVERIGPHAVGNHANVSVNGICLDNLFKVGGWHVLAHLRDSVMTASGDPARCRLMRAFMEDNGPMKGVLSGPEVALFSRWVEKGCPLPERRGPPSGHCDPAPEPSKPQTVARAMAGEDGRDDLVSACERACLAALRDRNAAELSYFTLNVDRYPYVRLAWPALGMQIVRALRSIAKKHFSEELNAVVNVEDAFSQIQRIINATKEARSMERALPCEPDWLRESYVSNYPSFCTDGAWLNGIVHDDVFGLEAIKLLFRTYHDECGAGSVHDDHNVIARSLLKNLGLVVPNLSDFSFYQTHPSRFVRVLIKLAPASRPDLFFPEILGLNLAIEANGITGRYALDSERLRAFGFSSRFPDLHVCSDNSYSGHVRDAYAALHSGVRRARSIGTDYGGNFLRRSLTAFLGCWGVLEFSEDLATQRVLGFLEKPLLRYHKG